MSQFFKSALGIFGNQSNVSAGGAAAGSGASAASAAAAVSANSQANSQFARPGNNDFVGQFIMIGNMKLRVTRVVAEGGYAIVYTAQDVSTGVEYALKRIFAADEAASEAIKEEISYLKQLKNHQNIINFVSAACEENSKSRSKEYLILTELCKEPLIDHLRAGLALTTGSVFNFEQVLCIFFQICRAVQFMHTQEPPIIHRDLKLENFLVSSDYGIKLCDFGSATKTVYEPDNSWSANKRNLIEDEIAKQTTPMYRAPEMLDLYSNYRIDEHVDIWALGCVLYLLCYKKHPFEDGAKLRIINGKYQIPAADQEFTDFHDLIRCMLNTDPSKRPNINEVLYHLENIAQTKSINLVESLRFLQKTESLISNQANPTSQTFQPLGANSANSINSSDARMNNAAGNASSNWMGNTASLFKGSSFLNSIKEASSKVMETVQHSINRNELDLTYITSRLIVMSCPTEGIESAAFGNNIEAIKEAIESKHGRNYRIYNLANKTYRKERFAQVIDLGMQLSNNKAPPITLMCKLSANVNKFLNENAKNVCVINCNDGKTISAIAVCSVLLYCRVLQSVEACLNLFHIKRGTVTLTANQLKFLKETHRLFLFYRNELSSDSFFITPNECILSSITLLGVPLFNRQRNGCTPYVEIYNKDKKIYTNLQDYDHMKKYVSRDGQVLIPINCHKFYGDILIIIFHAKSLLGTEKVTSTKICQFQFHTAFLAKELAPNGQFRLSKNELDGLDSPDKYPEPFQITLSLDFKNIESPQAAEEAWTNVPDFSSQLSKANKQILFFSNDEMNQFINVFDSANNDMKKEKPRTTPSINIQQQPQTEDRPKSGLTASHLVDFRHEHENLSPASSGAAAGYSPLAASPASTSPSSHSAEHQARPTREGNLLNLDDFGHTIDEAPVSNQTKLETDFSILLDFGEPAAGTPVHAAGSVEKSTPSNLENLLGGASFEPLNPTPVRTPSTTPSAQTPNAIFDPFGTFDVPTVRPTPPPATAAAANYQQKLGSHSKSNTNIKETNDPFAGLGAFTATSQQNLTSNGPLKHNTSGSRLSNPAQAPSPQPDSYPLKPNYSSSVFNTYTRNNSNTGASTNTTPVNRATMFDDIVPDSMKSKNQSGNKANMTMKEMKKEQNAKELDPDTIKVMEWTDGKRANIRALLCSLHKVLWDTAGAKWEPVGMHQLVSANDVKKIYRKAVLVVHPDKLTDDPNVNLARMIFLELNDSWAKFQSEAQQNLF